MRSDVPKRAYATLAVVVGMILVTAMGRSPETAFEVGVGSVVTLVGCTLALIGR
jgi:hypothetical protein